MCEYIKRFRKKGQYKETTWEHTKGQQYNVETYYKCGHCKQCLSEKANKWVTRDLLESREHKDICFITLTLKHEIDPIQGIRACQLFWKRLRQKIKVKIRYKQVRHYGKKGRMHWHAIIWGWTEKNPKFWKVNKKKKAVYVSETIERAWGLGITSYSQIECETDAEIKYTSLYTSANAYIRARIVAKWHAIYPLDIDKDRRNASIKKEYRDTREKITSSKGIGFASYIKNKRSNEKYKETMTVGKHTTFVPKYWREKMAEMGGIAEQEATTYIKANIKLKTIEQQTRDVNEWYNKRKNNQRKQNSTLLIK